MSPFPADVRDGVSLEYFPGPPPPDVLVQFVVVFVLLAEGFLLADIRGRGWCVPSGRVEAGETPLDAAERETVEETGYRPLALRPVGSFRTRAGGIDSWAEAFVTTKANEEGPPTGTDSQGRRAVEIGGLPAVYYRWGPFYEALFGRMAGLARP